MKKFMDTVWTEQQTRNQALLENALYLGDTVRSDVLPMHVDISSVDTLSDPQTLALQGLEIEAARIAILALASLAEINELDHLGGGLDLISAFALTLAVTDYQRVEYTIENAHTSIGYFSGLAAYGFLQAEDVIERFRRGIDIPGHVSWLPGGTQLNGGRLGVMVPVAVGQALGKRAVYGDGCWVITHCGDAGWISGQALNGFNGADLHGAPVSFVMHRNGIQLSGSNQQIMDKDPRPIISSLGITVLEIPSLHDVTSLYQAYREAFQLAQNGRPSMIYPVGYRSSDTEKVTLETLAERYGIQAQTAAFAAAHGVALDTEIWIPGALMSYRDVEPMLECVFLVNNLPGGKGHHDGHMKGRDAAQVLEAPMMTPSAAQSAAVDALRQAAPRVVVTEGRPRAGAANLILPEDVLAEVELPPVGKAVSPRAGVEAGYAAVAKTFPEQVFVVSCDLDASTKLGKARSYLSPQHQFEMSIEEQASALMANGLAMSCRRPQLNVFSTFAAFFEGIAREGFEMWRYQRNLSGTNEGLNVAFHMSHVGACTGRDHFSGWSLDWITLALGYLPYLHRFYAPADARAAFAAVRDMAARYGGHVIGVPRDNLPILTKQDSEEPLWEADSPWEPVTEFRLFPGAKRAILAFGAPAFLAAEAATELLAAGCPTDVYIVNGLPLPNGEVDGLFSRYSEGVVTIEDGLIATPCTGLRGFAGLVSSAAAGRGLPLNHVGIVDPRTAPSEGHMEVWEHFGITTEALVRAVREL